MRISHRTWTVQKINAMCLKIFVYTSSKTSERRLKKTRGRMKSLNLGASVEPLMAQAASHSHVSSIEISRCSSGEVNTLWFAGACTVLFFPRRANLEVLLSAASDELMHLNPFAALAGRVHNLSLHLILPLPFRIAPHIGLTFKYNPLPPQVEEPK